MSSDESPTTSTTSLSLEGEKAIIVLDPLEVFQHPTKPDRLRKGVAQWIHTVQKVALLVALCPMSVKKTQHFLKRHKLVLRFYMFVGPEEVVPEALWGLNQFNQSTLVWLTQDPEASLSKSLVHFTVQRVTMPKADPDQQLMILRHQILEAQEPLADVNIYRTWVNQLCEQLVTPDLVRRASESDLNERLVDRPISKRKSLARLFHLNGSLLSERSSE
jgi:hypothetical protein